MSPRPQQPRGRGGRAGRSQPLSPRPSRRTSRGVEPEADPSRQVEGRQAVRELLRADRRRVHSVSISSSSEANPLLDEIADLAASAGVPVREVPRERIQAIALTEAPQGVVAEAEPLREYELADLLAGGPGERSTASGDSKPFLVVLDGVTDPHNLGAVMRSALCAGATGLVIGRHRAATLGPTALKAAAGAAEWLPVATVTGIPAALGDLADAGVWTVGLDTGGDTDVWQLGVADQPVALVLGAEGSGLSRLVRKRCEVVASVPMLGPLDSLNVSAAAAVGCFAVARARAAAGAPGGAEAPE